MRLGLIALVATVSPTLAAARPITIGVTLGEAQSEAESGINQGPDEVYGAYLRVGLTRHVAVQLELARIDSDASYDVRTAGLAGVIDLGNGWAVRRLGGRFVPILLGGGGEAWGSAAGNGTTSYGLHLEAGLGIEYRGTSGLVIGGDARIGNRWMQTQAIVPYAGAGATACCGSSLVEDEGLYDGQYRSLRVTLGVMF